MKNNSNYISDLGKLIMSKEVQDSIKKRIEEDTWGKNLPMVYLENGWIIKHYKNGIKEKIKRI